MDAVTAKKIVALSAAIAVLAGGLFWILTRGNALGEMRIRAQEGKVLIERGDKTLTVTDETSIRENDVIVASDGALARMRLEGERELGLIGPARLEILGGAGVASQSGNLFAAAADPLKVMVGEAEIRSQKATFRVDRPYGTSRVGVYEGQAAISVPGSPGVTVDRLYQTEITAGNILDPTPYKLDSEDYWDQRQLGALIDYQAALESLSGLMANEMGRSLPSLAYFEEKAEQKVDFMRKFVAKQSPKRPGYTTDLLVGLFVADKAPGPASNNFVTAIDLVQRGGQWAVVSCILELCEAKSLNGVVAQLEGVVGGTGALADGSSDDLEFTLAGAETGPGSDSGTVGPGDPRDPGDPNPPPTKQPPTNPPPSSPKPPSSPPPPPPSCEGLVECTADEVVPPEDEPNPEPTDLFDPPPALRD